MRDVSIIGVGMTPVGEHYETSLRRLALQAVRAAFADSGTTGAAALFVGNALGGQLSKQEHLGALLADYAGMTGVEAARVDAGEASGGAALRQGYIAVASGAVDRAVVVGVEQVTDQTQETRLAAMLGLTDREHEGAQGVVPAAIGGLLMRRYLHEYGVALESFEGFSINAHANGARNPNAMYRNTLEPGHFARAPMVADPVNLFDIAPEGDGAAAVILAPTEYARDWVPLPVRIAGSALATDALPLHDRSSLLTLAAVKLAVGRALEQAGVGINDIDLIELHDAFTVLAALQLEMVGLAAPGEGWKLAAEGAISLDGRAPISTFGGLKSRGNPFGATGVYQAVEVALQVRGQAGANQVPGARRGLALNLGGAGATAAAHVLERLE
ncbi:MAG: thiolase domain-containing protein [Anaerolineae bacterium]|nr:thiolase domain-containing protein [Anaerolineae bacterium]